MVERPFIASPPVTPEPAEIVDWAVRQFRDIEADGSEKDRITAAIGLMWVKQVQPLVLDASWQPLVTVGDSPTLPGRYQFNIAVRLTGTTGGSDCQFRWVLDGVVQPGEVLEVGNASLQAVDFGPADLGLTLEATGKACTIEGGKMLLTRMGD